jgi:hypothetical protein
VKNKRLLYVLLPAVLAIWGLIFQRIWSAAAEESGPDPASTTRPRVSSSPIVARKTPRLLLTYGDPFKAGRISPVPRPVAEPSPGFGGVASPSSAAALNFPVAAPVAPAPPLVWPALRYLGSINNPRQKSQIALLAINDQEAMLKTGDNRQGLVLSKIFRDSVQVLFQGRKKTITRSLPQ